MPNNYAAKDRATSFAAYRLMANGKIGRITDMCIIPLYQYAAIDRPSTEY